MKILTRIDWKQQQHCHIILTQSMKNVSAQQSALTTQWTIVEKRCASMLQRMWNVTNTTVAFPQKEIVETEDLH